MIFADYVYHKAQPFSKELVEGTEQWRDWHPHVGKGGVICYYIDHNNPNPSPTNARLLCKYKNGTIKYLGLLIWDEGETLPDWILPETPKD